MHLFWEERMKTYEMNGHELEILDCEDLPNHQVRIKYILDSKKKEDTIEDRHALVSFFAGILDLDPDDRFDKNRIKLLMYADEKVFPLDEEGFPEPIHDVSDDDLFKVFNIQEKEWRNSCSSLSFFFLVYPT